MNIAVDRDTFVIHAVVVACLSLGGFGCGGKFDNGAVADAAAGGNIVDRSASPGVEGSRSSNHDAGSGSTSSSSGGDVSCTTTCIDGCCDSTGVCRNSGDTQCGLYGAACIDCTATGMTCNAGRCVGAEFLCEAGVVGAPVSPDAGACFIDITQYDHSCSVDSDCVSSVELNCAVWQGGFIPRRGVNLFVGGGDFCGNVCNCDLGGAISRSAVAQYLADVSRTPVGSGQVPIPICNCPPPPPLPNQLCVNGSCGR
jgi:hypothetical protein